jgi:hypothetical protein
MRSPVAVFADSIFVPFLPAIEIKPRMCALANSVP